jgi:peptidoglycan hydrolase CwlO-like protein
MSLLPFPSACPIQLEQSEAKCEDALKTQKVLTADLENMHSELENVTRSKSLVLSLPKPQKHRLRVLH